MRKAQPDISPMDRTMKIALVASFGLHIFVMFAGLIIWPHFKEPIEIATPVSVEMVDDISAAKTPQVKASKPEPKPEDKPKPPPKMEEETPPDLIKDNKPEDVSDTSPPPSEALDEPPEPKKNIPPPDKVKPKPKPPEKEVPKEPAKDFQSLLKNLTPDEPEDSAPQAQADAPNISEKLSISEHDALRAQLGRCWNVLAGAKYAENLAVEVFVRMNPDRTVAHSSIVDQSRYNNDSSFRAAADAAQRALKNPKCIPLELPPGKYNEWKTIIINFDPSEML